jgi:hypothetical protein
MHRLQVLAAHGKSFQWRLAGSRNLAMGTEIGLDDFDRQWHA